MSEFTTSKKTFFDRHEVVTNNLGGQVTQSRAHEEKHATDHQVRNDVSHKDLVS